MTPARCGFFFAAFTCLVSLVQPPSAEARNAAAYSSSMPKTYPRAYSAWRSHLPGHYRRIGWAARFQGDAKPIRAVTLVGRPMLFFESCKPHACTIDEADAVVAPDGATAFGVILHNGTPIAVGRPTPNQIACLRAFAESYVQSTC